MGNRRGVGRIAVSELRNTRQRTAVMDALNASNRFQSAQELHAALADAGTRVGLTTVYRTLGALAVAGDIDTVVSADGQVLYRRCDVERHHHHLVCRVCRRTVEVDGPAVEAWADQVADEHGFVDVSHTVEVFGRCRSCAAKP